MPCRGLTTIRSRLLGQEFMRCTTQGDFSTYSRIAEQNTHDTWAKPIYVGKAVPAGARKGSYGLGESPGEVLYRRLREHATSIQQAIESLPSAISPAVIWWWTIFGFRLPSRCSSRCLSRSGITISMALETMIQTLTIITSNGPPGTKSTLAAHGRHDSGQTHGRKRTFCRE